MKLRPFTGALTALVTPFRQDAVAYDDLRQLVNFQIKNGIDGLVPVGTTGESPTLSMEEHLEVIRAVVSAARGRVPVVAGTGSNSTREAVTLTREAHTAGADAMLVVAPYYNKPGPDGQLRHFSAIADSTDRPIILYSIPSRCGVEIPLSVIVALRKKYAHVRWIKESGGSVERVDLMKQALGNDITVLSGDDALTLPFMAAGAEGVISVASNLFPRETAKLVRFALADEYAKARKIHQKFFPIWKTLFIEPNPVPIKTAMTARGIISSSEVRLPLSAMLPANLTALESALEALSKAP